MKILLLDIETAPHEAYVWGLWNQNVGTNMLVDPTYMLCWAAKWYGKREVMFDSVANSTPLEMIKGIHKLMNEADVIVHYNGNRFDIPHLNREFIKAGLLPPAPAKHVDLLTVARRVFKFASNKMDYVTNYLGLGQKKITNFKLWVECMEMDAKAWNKMERYNKHDVKLLEKVYDEFKPWIRNHPNHSLYGARALVCPSCGGSHHQRRGFAFTKAGKYQRFQCSSCGGWFRDGKSTATKSTGRYTAL